jgi:nickel-type superoxide dismutase maturation protease
MFPGTPLASCGRSILIPAEGGHECVAAFAMSILRPMCSTSLPHATAIDICLWLLRRYRRFRVQGNSMLPTLRPDQEVLINPRAYRQSPPAPGHIVVVRHPQQSELLIVKRILFLESDDRCYLQGDNAIESTDSRQFGLLPLSSIAGKVHCLLP